MKIPLQKRIKNLTCWFNMENRRPLLGFTLGSQYPLFRYYKSKINLPDGIINAENIVVDDYLENYEEIFQTYEETGGDLIWSASPFFGIPWLEALAGCRLLADFKTGSVIVKSPKRFYADNFVPEFSESNEWIIKLTEFFERLKKESKNRYPVGVTLIRGISDLLSALYGSENLIMKMYDSPAEVIKTAEKITELWIKFGKFMLGCAEPFYGGTGAFFYAIWCPGKTIWLQEDSAALLSPNLYKKFIYPFDLKIINSFEHTIMHLHPAKFMPVDYLLKTNINVIEIHIDKGGPTAEDLYEQYIKVLSSNRPLLIWGDLTKEDLKFILKKVPPRGLAINMVTSSTNEAKKIWEEFHS